MRPATDCLKHISNNATDMKHYNMWEGRRQARRNAVSPPGLAPLFHDEGLRREEGRGTGKTCPCKLSRGISLLYPSFERRTPC